MKFLLLLSLGCCLGVQITDERRSLDIGEIEILKAASSKYLFNDVIAGQRVYGICNVFDHLICWLGDCL